jgi:hypothetical protein
VWCQVLQSYLSLLDGDDPALAARVAWDDNGHLTVEPLPQLAALEPGAVQLLEWDQQAGARE